MYMSHIHVHVHVHLLPVILVVRGARSMAPCPFAGAAWHVQDQARLRARVPAWTRSYPPRFTSGGWQALAGAHRKDEGAPDKPDRARACWVLLSWLRTATQTRSVYLLRPISKALRRHLNQRGLAGAGGSPVIGASQSLRSRAGSPKDTGRDASNISPKRAQRSASDPDPGRRFRSNPKQKELSPCRRF